MDYDIIIIGGGASGMTAAICAAALGAGVCIIEHGDRVGKKILSTGNGKCNLTNTNMSRECYNSSSQSDFYGVIRDFTPDDLTSFLASIGIYTRNKGGYIYPFSEQASSVLDGLRAETKRLGVVTEVSVRVKSCRKKNGKFEIMTDSHTYASRRLILAAGSKCAPKTGSDGSGYKLAETFGHSIVSVVPALVQLKCKEGFFKELHGVRTETALSLTASGKRILSERGELQLTDYGISGIPVFQLSGKTKRLLDAGEKPVIHIDFCHDYSDAEILNMLHLMLKRNKDAGLTEALGGLLNKKLANVIVKESGMRASMPCGSINENGISRIAALIKSFPVTPYDTNGFENAQVCSGGVSLDEVNLSSMESFKVSGLYFAGEILDVDGKCGGYNLHWAFASGRLAGISAAKASLPTPQKQRGLYK